MTHHDDSKHDESDAFERMFAEANQSILPPSGLERNISRKIGRAIAVRRVAAAGSVAAILLVVGVIFQVTLNTANPTTSNEVIAKSDPTNQSEQTTPDTPIIHRAAMVHTEPDSKFFAQAIPTSKPNVTIVRLYRDLTPARENEPEPDKTNEEIRDENTENTDQNADPANQPGAADPGGLNNETIIRSEA